jgi:hypothetical protein
MTPGMAIVAPSTRRRGGTVGRVVDATPVGSMRGRARASRVEVPSEVDPVEMHPAGALKGLA